MRIVPPGVAPSRGSSSVRAFVGVLLCSTLCSMSERAPADPAVDAGAALVPPEVQWVLHVLYLPGNQEARLPLVLPEGAVPVRAPWQCKYKRATLEREDIVKVKCTHDSGAVVGTLAMCRREQGQSDLAQLSIGIDGVAVYETIDLSCSTPRPGDQVYEQRR
jgi:hypothetical protein